MAHSLRAAAMGLFCGCFLPGHRGKQAVAPEKNRGESSSLAGDGLLFILDNLFLF